MMNAIRKPEDPQHEFTESQYIHSSYVRTGEFHIDPTYFTRSTLTLGFNEVFLYDNMWYPAFAASNTF